VPLVMVSIFCIFRVTCGYSQGFCGFDSQWDNIANGDIEQYQIYQQNEIILQNFMNSNAQAISTQTTYTIPVVFHVLHLNEAIGVGANISENIIINGLANLNQKMQSSNLQFCLAKRDPNGNVTSGINRINCSQLYNYGNVGLEPGGNEGYLKEQSIWTNSDYLNVWVVHNIYNPDPLTQILGLGTFPGTEAFLDGIVIRNDYLETGTTFAHEAAHFLDLYHTFHGSNNGSCPPNNDCIQDGDKVCDTHPHRRILGTCPPASINDCTNLVYGPTGENIMSYFSCRNSFTGGQITRMRGALMALRGSLLTSQGCILPCEFTTTFTPLANYYTRNFSYDFIGITNGNFGGLGVYYKWTLNNTVIGQNKNLNAYVFNNLGSQTLCFEAISNTGCISRKCIAINVGTVECDPIVDCNLIENGDFKNYVCSRLCGQNLNFDCLHAQWRNNVCFWAEKTETPDLLKRPSGNAIGYISTNGISGEIPIHRRRLNLVEGRKYIVCYKYLTSSTNNNARIVVGLANNPDKDDLNGMQIINKLDVSPDLTGLNVFNLRVPLADLYSTGIELHKHSFEYTHTGTNQFLYFDSEKTGLHNFYTAITDVVVSEVTNNCCNTISNGNCNLSFSSSKSGCGVNFAAIANSSYSNTVYWNFGDGTTGVGANVTHTYLYPGTFKVCATLNCDFDLPLTLCDFVTINPDECSSACNVSTINATALKCGDGPYITTFNLIVPKGTKPCSIFGPQLSGDGMTTSNNGYVIKSINSTTNSITINTSIIPNANTNLNAPGKDFNFTLCDTLGNPVCYTVKITGSGCATCETLNINLPCTDQNPFNGTNTYGGSLIIPNLPPGASLENLAYTLAGLSLGNLINGALPISYTTTNSGIISGDLIFSILSSAGIKCYRVKITNTPCPPPPTQCIQYWNTPPKPTGPCTVERGKYKFNFTMASIPLGYDLQICSFPVVNYAEGNGEVVVNSMSFNGRSLQLNMDIFMPCDFNQALNYEVKLYVCDMQGNVVCLSFLLDFPNCTIPCAGGGGQLGGRTKSDIPTRVYPNPTANMLYIESGANLEQPLSYQIIDHTGRHIKTGTLTQSIVTINTQDLVSGIYLIKVVDVKSNSLSINKVIKID
jgi:hypothetical protein